MKDLLYPEDVLMADKVIETLYSCCKSNNTTLIRAMLEQDDLDELCRKMVNAHYDGLEENQELERIIDVLTYLEENMGIPSPVSDTVYDTILEILNDENEGHVGISSDIDTNENTREHEYPELRGSLQKVHYPTIDDVPKDDTRKSLEKILGRRVTRFLGKISG